LVKGFEVHDLPLSAIHLDIDYMDQFKVFTINTARFPSLRRLTDFLAKKGIKTVASLNPAVKIDKNFNVYNDGLSKDVFCKLPNGEIFHGVTWPGWSVFPDFTNPDARKWWRDQYQSLTSEGISGIWHDMNEPASFAAWGDKSFPLTTLHSMEGRGGSHEEAHNLYGLLMNQAGYEALRANLKDKRPWLLSRSGWAGLQRYAWNWTADTETSWESLQQTIPTILGLGLSGHAFSGVDIGGFSGDPDAELFLRWFQLAAFLPLFRTHSSTVTKPREPWVYGEPTTSIIRKYLKLRYKLLPYLYTLAWDAAQTGIPPLRPLFWSNPAQLQFGDIQDEFLVGDVLLVAPILHKNETSRPVILPSGNWYSFWDDLCYKGRTQFTYPDPLSIIPLFIKAGTLLPMEEDRGLCFHVYPGEDIVSNGHLYSDAGDGYGSWRVDRFIISNELNSMDIAWSFEGDFPFSYTQIKYQVHGKKLVNAVCDGKQCTIQENSIVTPYAQRIAFRLE
jgi:alpha-glucosidase